VMEEAEESERPKLVRSLYTPTQAEIEEHESTGHVVYRDAGIASQDAVWDKDTRLEPVSKRSKTWYQLLHLTVQSCPAVTRTMTG